ncbi:PREDICTED: cysteine-rich tail protein 1 [Myotis brandtii]|uniref:cysteine-rich tail protein 1 n=1 Tax=Myotis brandtii TaxID=109478 RepID=UPI0007041869|nr:PREDICTED: cysteine-rich tail protein 1 [Myotis brandtii]
MATCPWGLRTDPSSPPGLLPGPARAWHVSRLSHPGWPCPSKPGRGHRPREGRVGARYAGGARASWELGNPIFEARPWPRPSPGGKREPPVAQLTGTGRTRGQTAVATPGRAMDPHEMAVKNPYTYISIPRAHLRPDLEQQLGAAPCSSELQPLSGGACALEPTRLLTTCLSEDVRAAPQRSLALALLHCGSLGGPGGGGSDGSVQGCLWVSMCLCGDLLGAFRDGHHPRWPHTDPVEGPQQLLAALGPESAEKTQKPAPLLGKVPQLGDWWAGQGAGQQAPGETRPEGAEGE